MKVSFFTYLLDQTRAMPSLINLQIREKEYDFHNLVVQITIFYSADLRTRFARAANFLSRKKKYYFTHLLHK
jgi:hypothetical protein